MKEESTNWTPYFISSEVSAVTTVPDRYATEERSVDKYVDEIKSLGYDVSVEHMCGRCYEKKYREKEQGLSVSVFHFKHVGENVEVVNIADSDDLHILSEFLKGNLCYKGDYDETIWINRDRNVVERLLGIKVEE